MVYCSKCGQFNTNAVKLCTSCGSVLMKKEYSHLKSFNSFDTLFSKENLKALENARLSEDEYNMIIKNICDLGDYSYKKQFGDLNKSELEKSDILTKIIFITSAYANIHFKSKGAELGSYAYNLINVDDRLNSSEQISTLIHELSHHLLAEIFEQILMYVWDVKKTNEIESFSHIALIANDASRLMNEYCAHTVEGRFIPHGYQNYGSFNMVLSENFDLKRDQDAISLSLLVGNTFAEDIIKIIEHFIPYDLREEIKAQFKADNPTKPSNPSILLEHNGVISFDNKIGFIFTILQAAFKVAKNKGSRDFLNYLNSGYDAVNNAD